MDVANWFKGFEKGIAMLPAPERELFFSECGKHCVTNSVLPIYRDLYKKANGNMDIFFQKANELPGVKGEVIETGHIYHLFFLTCTCKLHQEGYINTPLLCECSRQSVLYALHSLWNNKNFHVTVCHSILRGERDCKLKIEVSSCNTK